MDGYKSFWPKLICEGTIEKRDGDRQGREILLETSVPKTRMVAHSETINLIFFTVGSVHIKSHNLIPIPFIMFINFGGSLGGISNCHRFWCIPSKSYTLHFLFHLMIFYMGALVGSHNVQNIYPSLADLGMYTNRFYIILIFFKLN